MNRKLNLFLLIAMISLLMSCSMNNVPSNPSKPDERFNPGGSPEGQGSSINTAQYEFSTTLDKSDFTGTSALIPEINEDSLKKLSLADTSSEATTLTISGDTLVTLTDFDLDSDAKGLVLTGNGNVYFKLEGDNSITSVKNVIDADELTGDLYFYGSGSLNLYSSGKGGIKAKKSAVSICSGTYEISLSENSGGDGIRCSNFTIYGGKLTINALGKLVKDEYTEYPGSKGLQAKAVTGSGDGNIVIRGGEIEILSYGKGITANYGDYETSGSCGNVVIKNGAVTVRTTGTPVEDTSEEQEDGISPEGIEAKNNLTIEGGLIQICSTDDSLNGLSSINVSGGYIFGLATKNDCIDSNSKILVSGGTIIALSTAGGSEKAIDTDIGESRDAKFIFNGGLIVAISKEQSDVPNSGKTSCYLQKSADVSSTLSVKNGSEEIVRYCLPEGTGFGNSACMLVCSEDASSSATIERTGATVSATANFNGLDLSLYN